MTQIKHFWNYDTRLWKKQAVWLQRALEPWELEFSLEFSLAIVVSAAETWPQSIHASFLISGH